MYPRSVLVVQAQKAQQASLWRKTGVTSLASDTHVAAPALSANIAPGLVTGDGVSGHRLESGGLCYLRLNFGC